MHGKAWTRNFGFFVCVVSLIHILSLFLHLKIDSENKLAESQPEAESTLKVRLHQTTHKKQIVQSEDPTEEKSPVDNAFLSDKNRTFDRQTVSRQIESFKKAAKGNAEVDQQRKTLSKTKDKKEMKLSDVGLAHSFAQNFRPIEDEASQMKAGKENGELKEMGLSATNDYLDEMTLGDFTHLNTTEFKHYGFYHRIRQKLEQFWGRSVQEKAQALYKSGRAIASADHITAMTVTLNERGEIVEAVIKSSSGVRELDQAAVESFNQAGPFPNPPKDLLKDGRAVIEWGFVVKT